MSCTRRLGAVVLAATVAVLAACGSSPAAGPSRSPGLLSVTTSFYPLEFAAERIGGQWVQVNSLTAPGVEPHDLELTPKQVVGIRTAQVVIYLRGFQPAVDDAIDAMGDTGALDVSGTADLLRVDQTGMPGSGHGALDPHFWLDPIRYAAVVTAIGAEFAVKDPAHAATYRSNATALVGDLTDLDTDYRQGLGHCVHRDLVTGHAAFGYLALRYGFTQRAITGLSPDAEPDAASMARLIGYIREHDVTTVYTETLTSPALAETIARNAGAKVAVLDPIEGVTTTSLGADYLEIMRSNLATLTVGQQCS